MKSSYLDDKNEKEKTTTKYVHKVTSSSSAYQTERGDGRMVTRSKASDLKSAELCKQKCQNVVVLQVLVPNTVYNVFDI